MRTRRLCRALRRR